MALPRRFAPADVEDYPKFFDGPGRVIDLFQEPLCASIERFYVPGGCDAGGSADLLRCSRRDSTGKRQRGIVSRVTSYGSASPTRYSTSRVLKQVPPS